MSEPHPKTVEQMVAEAEARVENLPVDLAVAEIGGSGDVTLIDVREDDERFLEGTIPGAVHVPRGMLELAADPTSPLHRKELDPSFRVILYCSSGSRSALAADTLRSMGYANAAHISGGMMAWKRDGHPVEQIGFG